MIERLVIGEPVLNWELYGLSLAQRLRGLLGVITLARPVWQVQINGLRPTYVFCLLDCVQPICASPPHAGASYEGSRRGLRSSRRFARALTAAPLRPAKTLRFARMVRGVPQGGCHATRSHTRSSS
jgi:hypothetical protein